MSSTAIAACASACNFDGRLIALIGPNEAGKSSVLYALAWHTSGENQPLATFDRSRDAGVTDEQEAVRATFVLDGADLAVIDDIESDERPNRLVVTRTARGSRTTGVFPRIDRARAPRKSALTTIANLFGEAAETDLATSALPEAWREIEPILANIKGDLDQAVIEAINRFADQLAQWLGELEEENDEETPQEFPMTKAAIESLRVLVAQYASDHPSDVARAALWKRSSDFPQSTRTPDRSVNARFLRRGGEGAV